MRALLPLVLAGAAALLALACGGASPLPPPSPSAYPSPAGAFPSLPPSIPPPEPLLTPEPPSPTPEATPSPSPMPTPSSTESPTRPPPRPSPSPTPEPAPPSPTPSPLTLSLSLEAWEYGFTLPGQAPAGEIKGGPTLRVRAGSRVRLSLANRGSQTHSLVVVDQGGNAYTAGAAIKVLEPGQEQTIEFIAERGGSFLYICPVSDHWARGMAGSFVVEP